jgi:hypothetical protein
MVHHIVFLNHFTRCELCMPNPTDTADHSLSYSGVALLRYVNPLRVCQLRLPGLSGEVGTILINGNRTFPTSPSNSSNWRDDGQKMEMARLGPSVPAEWLSWGSECRPQTSRVSVAASVKLC